jgi:hypothetical protein
LKGWEHIRKRVEAYLAAIVLIGGGGAYVVDHISNTAEDSSEQITRVEKKVDELAVKQEGDVELLGEKLKPLDNLKEELEKIEEDFEAITVVATRGALEAAQLLEGRFLILQRRVEELQEYQLEAVEALGDSLYIIQVELDEIRRYAEIPDTIVRRDTVLVKKKSWIKRLFN